MVHQNSQIDYEEEEKLMPSRIKEVKAVLKDKHGLDVPSECDDFIERCLRTKDGVLDKTIKLIIEFRQTIVDFQKWDATLQPTLYEEFYNSFALSPLSQRDRQGRPILCFRVDMWNPDKMSFDEVVFASWMLAQHLIKESTDVQRNGFAVILYYSHFTLKQAWALKQWRLLGMARWAQNGVVGRLKGVHLVLPPKIIRALYRAMRPFLHEKLKKRIFCHPNFDSLHEHIDPKGLPKFLGGKLESTEKCIDMHFMEELLLQDDYFKDFTVKTLPSK